MFKKTKIAAAVLAAAAATSAQAVSVNTDGVGQVALLPYYNVNNNFVTNISITNTTDRFKAVKVRFRESNLSNDVLDFNVYMSPQDQWTASIRMNAGTGKANIITRDETCTYPDKALLQAGVDFLDFYTAVDTNDTLEGYVEIIEMGEVANGDAALDSGLFAEIDASGTADGAVNTVAGDRSIPAGLLHDATGMPADCTVVNDAWVAGTAGPLNGFTRGVLAAGVAADASPTNPYVLAENTNNGLVAPGGGLHAFAILLNTATGAAFVEEGTHLDGYATVPQHYQSDDQDNYLLPSLASGDDLTAQIINETGTAIANKSAGILTTFDTGAFMDIAPNAPIPAGANPAPVAIALSAMGVATPYFVDASVSGSTDVVMTMPMRKHGIWNGADLNLDADGAGPLNACVAGVSSQGYALFPVDGGADCTNWSWDAHTNDDAIISLTYYDDEEQVFTPAPGAPGFSPVVIGTPTVTSLPREVNIISIVESGETTTSVLGTPSDNVTTLTLADGFQAGWASIAYQTGLYDYVAAPSIVALFGAAAGVATTANNAATIEGVPTIGFTAMTAEIGPAAVGETVEHIRMTDRDL